MRFYALSNVLLYFQETENYLVDRNWEDLTLQENFGLSEADLFSFENCLKLINEMMIKYQSNLFAKQKLFEKFTELKNIIDEIVLNTN